MFGSFDENLKIQQPVNLFSEFVLGQIQKWIAWHRTVFADAYVLAYAEWLLQYLDAIWLYLDCCQPLFCHGDFDLKNILVQTETVIGLLDWEHAGVYCFEWELRKLSRFYHRQPEFLEAFFKGYFGRIPDNHSILKQAVCFMEATDLLGHLSGVSCTT